MRGKRLLVRIGPRDVAMFRFLLEAHDNLAIFTVLERDTALLKVMFTPASHAAVLKALEAIGKTVPLQILPWPLAER